MRSKVMFDMGNKKAEPNTKVILAGYAVGFAILDTLCGAYGLITSCHGVHGDLKKKEQD